MRFGDLPVGHIFKYCDCDEYFLKCWEHNGCNNVHLNKSHYNYVLDFEDVIDCGTTLIISNTNASLTCDNEFEDNIDSEGGG